MSTERDLLTLLPWPSMMHMALAASVCLLSILTAAAESTEFEILGNSNRFTWATSLTETLMNGDSLLAEAKSSLYLADTILQSMLSNGVSVQLAEIKPSIAREHLGKIRLRGTVSVSPTADLFTAINQIARKESASLSEVSIYASEIPGGFYNQLSFSLQNVLVKGELVNLPDTTETREALWHLREALSKIRIAIEFFGDNDILAVCRLHFWGVLYPGVERGEDSQELDSYWVRESIQKEIASSPAYFASEAEFREYRRLDQQVMAYWKGTMEDWQKKGIQEGRSLEEDMPMDVREATTRKRRLFSEAWDRWLRSQSTLFRVKQKTSQEYENEMEDWKRMPTDPSALDRIQRRYEVKSPLLLLVRIL